MRAKDQKIMLFLLGAGLVVAAMVRFGLAVYRATEKLEVSGGGAVYSFVAEIDLITIGLAAAGVSLFILSLCWRRGGN